MAQIISSLLIGLASVLNETFGGLWETVSSTIWEIFFRWFYEMYFNAIAELFEYIGNLGLELFELDWVKAFIQFFQLFGWALFATGLIVAIFDTAIEYQSMQRINIKRQILPFIWGFLAVNLFTTVPVKLYEFCVNIQEVFMKDLNSIAASEWSQNFTGLPEAAKNALNTLNLTSSFSNIFFITALAYCVIKVFFANIKRSGILLTQIAVGSLYMFSIPKGNTEGFVQWMRQVIALCVTAFLQTTLLYLGLITFVSANKLLGLGVMLAANEVPQVAKMFGMDTSVKVNMMSTVHAATTAVNFTRTIAKK